MKRYLPHYKITPKGFTLVEIGAAIAVIAILSVIALPAAKGALDRSKMAKCTSNLRQLGTGIQLYMTDNDGYLPQAAEVASDSNTQWHELIAPYIVNSGSAGAKRFAMRQILRCPGNEMKDGIEYGGNTWLRPSQNGNAPKKLINLEHKLSDFMLVTENYTGETWGIQPWEGPGTNPARVDYTRHGSTGVANFLFADFHIEPLSYQAARERPVIVQP